MREMWGEGLRKVQDIRGTSFWVSPAGRTIGMPSPKGRGKCFRGNLYLSLEECRKRAKHLNQTLFVKSNIYVMEVMIPHIKHPLLLHVVEKTASRCILHGDAYVLARQEHLVHHAAMRFHQLSHHGQEGARPLEGA